MIFWLPLHVVDDRPEEYGLKGGQIMRGECYDWDFLSLTKSEKCSSNFPLLVIQEVEFLCSKILFKSTLRGTVGWDGCCLNCSSDLMSLGSKDMLLRKSFSS